MIPCQKIVTYANGILLTVLSQHEYHRIIRTQGREWDIIPRLPALLEEASFQDVKTTEYILPNGSWPKDPKLKEIGRFFRAQFADGAVESYSLALFTRYGDWKPIEVQVLLAHLRSELKSNKMHAYGKLLVMLSPT
ncbi:phosphoethanolamine N-methyltransferase [Penicillium taxi]|uniref:phosphoethanolamine N-methyltransferase n=1 Tax=Penicillium taxi TaxID=168475 RepID=UPI00254576A1|nr:phosphoethanolamine N-methyltransferase [Penicillium taxi]KAJ5895682.1 phosphoethanolamine N-methyltransferase [Penicillium taxi]